jgi:hypothetical protein
MSYSIMCNIEPSDIPHNTENFVRIMDIVTVKCKVIPVLN